MGCDMGSVRVWGFRIPDQGFVSLGFGFREGDPGTEGSRV